MIIYLPCRLGERFVPLKFVDWVDGKRVYETGTTEKVLQGFWKSLFNPDIFAEGSIYSYDPTEKFGKGYEPKYKVSIPFGRTDKLCEMGFPGKRTAKLYGIVLKDGVVMADFVTTDRHEHLRYPIKDNLLYCELDDTVEETQIEYCKLEKVAEQVTIFDLGVK